MRDKNNVRHQPPRRHLGVYIGISLAMVFLYLLLSRLAPVRIGDGSEYYGLYLAWRDTLRPWMSAVSFASYEQLYIEHGITGLVPTNWFDTAFPALKLADTADFNHFWFYSLLAFIVSKTVSFVGLVLVPHQAFLALHWLLLCITGAVAYRLYGNRGVLVFAVLTFLSPMLWFTDKVHTEIFTYCLTLMGMMFVFSRMYLAAGFALALAATQNPSFALVAFVPFAYRFVLLRTQRFTFIEVCLVVATALAVLAHPVYYFLRFGVLTPQLLAGGASLGSNLSTFYIWILDPDLGLLPNWPIGVVFILTAALLAKWGRDSTGEGGDRPFYLFLIAFFVINFYAHSSTLNLNSGGTQGLARYSLWYLPGFFPLVYFVTRHLPFSRWITILWAVVLLGLGISSIQQNNPAKPEQYEIPSPLSEVIQTRAPNLYSPPAEVFAERFSGYGESIERFRPRGVLGPDCRKLLLMGGPNRHMLAAPESCLIDTDKLARLVESDFPMLPDPHYVRLSDAQFRASMFTYTPGHYSMVPSGNGLRALGEGWHAQEPWGLWSTGDASLYLLCNSAQPYATKKSLNLTLDVQPFAQQAVQVSQAGRVLFEGAVPGDNLIPISLEVGGCTTPSLKLDIHVKDARSAADLGASTDSRKLGLGLRGFNVLP
jgi:hypothetical protein